MKLINHNTVKPPDEQQEFYTRLLHHGVKFKQVFLRLQPGQSIPVHITDDTTIFYVLKGKPQLYLNKDETIAAPGDTLLCPAGSSRCILNKTASQVEILITKIL